MSIQGVTISGGFPDPEATGLEPPGTILNAVNEYSDFVDKINVTLVNEDPLLPGYMQIVSLTTNVTISGTPITSNELTSNGNVTLNINYNSPNTNTVAGLTVVTQIESGNTVGNIYITGNIQNAFPDKYWMYRDFTTRQDNIVNGPAEIPDDDVGLHLYKPSFMRYVNLEFNVTAVFDTGVENKTVTKKVVNSWEINRIALLSQIAREEAYRANNYPKGEA